MDALRLEVERTECCQGFTYSHSASGGTGSGMAMSIYKSAKYENNLIEKTRGSHYFFTVLPSSQISNTVVEPYNCVMVLNEQKDKYVNAVCFDNESLFNICSKSLGIKTPNFADLNRCISMVMSGNTAS